MGSIDVSGIISDVIQYVKQNQIDKAQKLLDAKMDSFYHEEVRERRSQVAEITRSIVKINIELKKLEIQYNLIRCKVPGTMLKTIDRYIYDLKMHRAELEIAKKRIGNG